MHSDADGGARHARRDEAPRFADKLAGEIEAGPRIDVNGAGERRLDAEFEKLAKVLVGAPDPAVVGSCSRVIGRTVISIRCARR